MFEGSADWISPGYDDEHFAEGGHPAASDSPPSRWYADPPVSDGTKVVITDTDHYAPGQGDALWAWKSFLRGHHPILMDFGLIGGMQPTAPVEGVPPYEAFEPARWALGDTLRYATRMQLVAMTPRGDLSSTGHALANPGQEYLVLEPNATGEPFSVTLAAGSYTVEWYSIASRETAEADPATVTDAGPVRFTAPFAAGSAAVLYLKRTGS